MDKNLEKYNIKKLNWPDSITNPMSETCDNHREAVALNKPSFMGQVVNGLTIHKKTLQMVTTYRQWY